MDELVQATGLSKMSVYRLFPSKDALVGAYLGQRSERLLSLIDAEITAHLNDPRSALRAIFAAVDHDTAQIGFRGCPFNNASVEFDDPEHPARIIAREYKQALLDRLILLCEQLRPGQGSLLAAQLHLLVDGMYLSAGILGHDGPASQGLSLVEKLLNESAK